MNLSPLDPLAYAVSKSPSECATTSIADLCVKLPEKAARFPIVKSSPDIVVFPPIVRSSAKLASSADNVSTAFEAVLNPAA